MPDNMSVTYDGRKLQRLIQELPGELAKHLDASAFSIEAHAKAPGEFPVDTGALRASGYVSGASGSGGTTYAAGRAGALQRRPGARIASEAKPEHPWERLVVFPMAYAAWVLDIGRKGRPGFPALTMAVEQERRAFFQGIGELIRRLTR